MSHQTEGEGFWFRIGYALGRTGSRRGSSPEEGAEDRPSRAHQGAKGRQGEDSDGGGSGAGTTLLAAAAGSVAARLVRAWAPRREPGFFSLAASAAVGAGTALVVELASGAIRGKERRTSGDAGDLGDRLLTGAGRGLVYGGVFAPRFPGPPVVRGAAFGTAEYLAGPWGGLTHFLGRTSPHRKLPFGRELLEPGPEEGARDLAEHLVFGVILAVTYGSLAEKRGTSHDS